VNSLSWLGEIFHDARTEDIVTLCFYFWLFTVSLLAILNDSIPHLAVCVASHFLDTAWAGFRVKTTIQLHSDYNEYIVQGACNGTDILGDWWDVRLSHAIPIAVCNFVVLVAVMYLSWMLFWAFAKQTFSRVGASPAINRAYKLVLCFEAEMGLAAFFGLASSVMWIDRMYNGDTARNNESLRIILIVATATWPLWILSGCISIRREFNWLFLCFGLFQSLILAVWLVSFASPFYRFEIISWPFFSCVSITSFVFLLFTGLTGCVCRLNYGKGLAHFLKVQAALDSAGFAPGCFPHDHTRDYEIEPKDEDYARNSRYYELNHKQPPNTFLSALERLMNAVYNAIRRNKSDPIDFGPNRLSDGPKFKLPTQPTTVFSLPTPRKPTLSMFTESSIGSTGDIVYASRNPLTSATARTMNVSREPRSTQLRIDDDDGSPNSS